jgi:hypothetical protein
MVFGTFGVQWVMPRKVLDLLSGWLGNLGWTWLSCGLAGCSSLCDVVYLEGAECSTL